MDDAMITSRSSMRSILSHDFIVSFFALFTFIIGYHALIPTLPIFLARFGSNERDIGVLVGIFGFSSLAFRFLVGNASAKYSEKTIMLFAALLYAATFLVSTVLRPFWPFFIIRFSQGIAFAFFDTAALAYAVKTVPQEYRGQAIGYFMLAVSFSQAIAPPFAMFIINRYTFTFFFLSCMGLSLLAFLLSLNLSRQEDPVPTFSSAPRDRIFAERKIIVPAVTSFMQHFIWGALIAFLPLYAVQHGIANPGIFFSANAIMLIAGRSLGGKVLNVWDKEKIIMISIFVATAAMAILSLSKTLFMITATGVLWGVSGAFFYPASIAYALDYAGSSDSSAVGTLRALMDLGLVLGPMIMGVIVPMTGYPLMFSCLALISILNLIYFHFYVRRQKHKISPA